MSQTTAIAGPRQQFLSTIAQAAKEFATGQPLSVSQHDLQRSIDRVMVAFRQAAVASPDLLACDPKSIARAIGLSALTGLQPGGPLPDVYLLPQRQHGVLTCDWRISWRGYATLAQRAGYRLRAVAVHEGDEFEYSEGLFPTLDHRPQHEVERTYDTLRCVYVVAHRLSAEREVPPFLVVSRQTIEARRAASPSRNSGPWQSWPLEMALKAAIRYAIQRGLVPLDEVAAQAYSEDRETIEAQPATENTYFIEPTTTQQPRGLQAVVAAAEFRAPVEPPISGSQGSAGASDSQPAKRGRGRPRKEAAPVDHVAEAQRQERQRLLEHAKAAVGELSGAEYEALRERLGLGEEADLGDLGAEQLDRVVREASAIVDERGAE